VTLVVQHIRLSWMCLAAANALAYNTTVLITAVFF
jgi:hypothetical protein